MGVVSRGRVVHVREQEVEILDLLERDERVDLALDGLVDLGVVGAARFAAARVHHAAHEARDPETRDGAAEAIEEVSERLGQGLGVLVAAIDILCQRALDNLDELVWDIRAHRLHVGDLGHLDLLEGLVVGLAEEEAPPHQHLPQQDPHREDVRTKVDPLAVCGLRREIAKLAFDHAGIGLLDLALCLGEPEVRDLDLALARHQHVGRADITVHDVQRAPFQIALVVRVREPLADLDGDVDHLLHRELDVLPDHMLQDILEVGPVDELHHDEVGAIGDPEIEDLDAVGVVEVERDLGFIQEHADEALVFGQRWEDALDGHQLLEALHAGCLGLEDLGHTTRVDTLDNLISRLRHSRDSLAVMDRRCRKPGVFPTTTPSGLGPVRVIIHPPHLV